MALMRNMALRLAAMLLVLATFSCAGSTTRHLNVSPDVPAARGTIKTGTTSNGNTSIELSIEHLAPPERVAADASTYVVWIRGSEPESRIQNLGALRVDDNLQASMKALTPLREFDLTVTAERAATVLEPTGKVLLEGHVERK
jgi:hypothetical protein